MRLLYIILLLLLNLSYLPSVAARHKYVFKLENKPPPFKSNEQYKNLLVIDARANKDNIGSLRKGDFGRWQPVVTEVPIDTFFQNLYDQMKVGGKTNDEELVMVLYRLEMSDNAGSIGTLCFNAQFYKNNNGQYKLLGKVDSLYEMRFIDVITDVLIEKVQKKLPSILADFAGQTHEISNEIYTLQQIANRRGDLKSTHPIYKAAFYKKGVYYTPGDFINNIAVDTPIIEFTYWKGDELFRQFYYKNEKGKRGNLIKQTTFFAIYDGENWWLNDSNTVRKGEFVYGDLYTTKHLRQAYTGATGDGYMAAGFVGGGLLGMFVAASVVDEVSKNKVRYSRAMYRAVFDPEAKEFVPISRPK